MCVIAEMAFARFVTKVPYGLGAEVGGAFGFGSGLYLGVDASWSQNHGWIWRPVVSSSVGYVGGVIVGTYFKQILIATVCADALLSTFGIRYNQIKAVGTKQY